MSKLTVKKMMVMSPRDIFAKGITTIEHPWYDADLDKEVKDAVCDKDGMTKVKWIAVKGSGHDWAVYHSISDSLVSQENQKFNTSHLGVNDRSIHMLGTKMTDMEKVKELVPCDSGAFKRYRK